MSSQKHEDLDLKGADLIQAKLAEFLAAVVQNPKVLFGGGAILLLVLAGGFGVRRFIENKENTRRAALAKIDSIFEDETEAQSKLKESLEKQRDTLKAALPKPAKAEKDTEVTENSPAIKALDEQIKAAKADHSKSAVEYQNFYKANSKANEGWIAGLRYASYAIEQKKLEDAQAVLDEIVKNAKGHNLIQTQALIMSVAIAEDLNQFDKALSSVETLEKTVTDDFKPRVLLTKAQIHYFRKDFANCKAAASRVVSEFESSPEADRARSLLALLPE